MPCSRRAGRHLGTAPDVPERLARPGGSGRPRPSGRPALAALALACGLAVLATPGVAQYQWRDADGRMVFSDQPPPPSVPKSRILRAEPMAPAPGPASAAPSRPQESAADRQLEAKRKAAEAAEAAKKRQAETEQAARLAKACDDALADQRLLDSGIRIARINADGEREFLSDEDRAQRSAATQRAVKDFCKGR